ncbi:glucosamine-6-phosphate deaminase, partial [Candidatus Roizmanbacteria bacterium CG_4_10_14_0_2_um_filter_36_9]
PTSALTMGIGTILEAKEIVLLATGRGKQKVFDKLIALKEPTTDIPASFLINHPLVTVFTDLSKEV